MMSLAFSPLTAAALALFAYLLIRTPRLLFAEATGVEPSKQEEWGLSLVLLASGLVAYAVYQNHTQLSRFAFGLATMSLVGVVYADLRSRVLPNLYAGILVMLAVLAPWRLTLSEVLVGIIMCGGLLWALGFIWRTLKSSDAVGAGDVKLAAAVGALVGPQQGLIAIAGAAAASALVVLGVRLIRKPSPDEETPPLHFGAALALIGMALLTRGLL